MKLIEFKDNSAQRVYLDYIQRSKKQLAILSDKDKEDCLLEINSHIYEALGDSSLTEMESLLNILVNLGPPEETLKALVAEKKTSQAIKTFNPKHLIQALVLNIKNGFIYIFLFILSILLISFPILAVLKLINPEQVGFFAGKSGFYFGFTSTNNYNDEILGNWFIPVTLLIFITLYFTVIFLLKILKNKS